MLRRLLANIGRPQASPTVIFEDNTGAIKLAGPSSVSQRRHIDIRYHSVRQQILQRKIVLEKIATADQLADNTVTTTGYNMLHDATPKASATAPQCRYAGR